MRSPLRRDCGGGEESGGEGSGNTRYLGLEGNGVLTDLRRVKFLGTNCLNKGLVCSFIHLPIFTKCLGCTRHSSFGSGPCGAYKR